MAEQKFNELAEHIENMIEKQNDIIEDLNNSQDEYVLNRKSNKTLKRNKVEKDQLKKIYPLTHTKE